MQIITEKEFARDFPMGFARVYVEESRTNYYVTIHPFQYALPVTLSWKVSKRQAKTMQDAIDIIYADYESRNGGWKWVQK